MHICVSSLLKCKMHLHLPDFVKLHLHYTTIKFKMQIYIYIILIESLTKFHLPATRSRVRGNAGKTL
jgi:hypothetical protein